MNKFYYTQVLLLTTLLSSPSYGGNTEVTDLDISRKAMVVRNIKNANVVVKDHRLMSPHFTKDQLAEEDKRIPSLESALNQEIVTLTASGRAFEQAVVAIDPSLKPIEWNHHTRFPALCEDLTNKLATLALKFKDATSWEEKSAIIQLRKPYDGLIKALKQISINHDLIIRLNHIKNKQVAYKHQESLQESIDRQQMAIENEKATLILASPNLTPVEKDNALLQKVLLKEREERLEELKSLHKSIPPMEVLDGKERDAESFPYTFSKGYLKTFYGKEDDIITDEREYTKELIKRAFFRDYEKRPKNTAKGWDEIILETHEDERLMPTLLSMLDREEQFKDHQVYYHAMSGTATFLYTFFHGI
jgi:hypothetical protein